MRAPGRSFKRCPVCVPPPLTTTIPPCLHTPGPGPLTGSEAGCVVFDACQVQVVVPAFQVLIHTVALAARLGVVVTVVAPVDTSGTSH